MNLKNHIRIAGALLILTPLLSKAAPSINDMQSCQALLDFIDDRLESPPNNYPIKEVEKVREGLEGYDQYIQNEIVSPGLLAFNGGDAGKTKEMQKQVDAYKKALVKSFQTRYTGNRIFMDQVIAVNNCTKKAVPSGQALEKLKEALSIMMELAKIN